VPFFPEANPLRVLPSATFAGNNALPSPPTVAFTNRYPFTARNPIKNVSANLTRLRGQHNLKGPLRRAQCPTGPARPTFNGS
jgi:hypothetical protein